MKTATHNGMTFTGFQKKSTHAVIVIRSHAEMVAYAESCSGSAKEWHMNQLSELAASGHIKGDEVHMHFACASSLQLAEKRRAEKAKYGHATYIVELN